MDDKSLFYLFILTGKHPMFITLKHIGDSGPHNCENQHQKTNYLGSLLKPVGLGVAKGGRNRVPNGMLTC